MASTYYLLDDAMHVEEQIVQKYEQAHTAVKKSHRAAVIIQRYYRGHAVRQRLEKQRIAAIVLQKHTRGWLVRYHLPDIMQQRYDELCLNYYDRMATKIQALWRGVLARKRVCLKLLLEKKRLTEERLKRFTVPPKSSDSSASHFNRFYIEKILTLLFDRHHLLSTRVAKGIFAQKSKSEISEIEKLLTSMPWKKYKKQYTEIANEYFKRVKCIPYQYSDSRLRHQEDLLRLRAPRENKKQILDVEIEDDFLAKPFVLTKRSVKKSYESQMSRQGKYFVRDTKILRTEDRSKNVSKTDFRLQFKKIAEKCDVPPYYVDFWCESCNFHV